MSRKRMLELLHSIDEPQLIDLGCWVGGWDYAIATSDGLYMRNAQDGTGIYGPMKVDGMTHAIIQKAIEEYGEKLQDHIEDCDDSSPLYQVGENDVAMVKHGCKLDLDYYCLKWLPELDD